MRGWTRAPALVAAIVLLSCGAPVRASETILQVGLRAGYVFGRGWTVGPVLSVTGTNEPSSWFWINDLVIFGGLAASADVVVSSDASPSDASIEWRLHVGPELGMFHKCRAFGGTLDLGVFWSLRRATPVRVGLEAGGALIGALVVKSPGEDPLFGGLAYRYGELLRGEGDQELALDVRRWIKPSVGTVALCSVFGGEPSRFID